MSTKLTIGLLGAAGRMGQAVQAEIAPLAQCTLGFAVDQDVTIPDWSGVDVVIDFTSPGSTASHAVAAAAEGTALVVGTTGLRATDHAALDEAAKKVAVVQAGNFSMGVTLLSVLVEKAAGVLGPDWDIEIFEAHHRHKVDSPSGTALLLGEAAAAGRGVALDHVAERARDGVHGERAEGAIGFSSMRAGAIIGEHDAIFASRSERIMLSHKAEDRSLFAVGALKAAVFAAAAAPGRYTMRDVLGL